jgi:3-dehydroquinate synthase
MSTGATPPNLHIGNAPDMLQQFLERNTYSRIFLLVDENTQEFCVPSLVGTVDALAPAEILEIESGEASKCLDVASQLWRVMNELNGDRHSLLVNLGGGVITDLGGFVASLYKRGIDFVHIPTTLLAQVDASIGGKTGVDLDNLKNMVGTFSEPALTIVDGEFLRSLSRRELFCGLAEMAKHALVADKDYWEEILKSPMQSIEDFQALIPRSIAIKWAIVSADPKETGERKALNFGHTIGHAIESFAMEGAIMDLRHGEAVAIGMVCEAWISMQRGWISEQELNRICCFVKDKFPAFLMDEVHFQRVLELMRHDKKNKAGTIRMALLKGIGACKVDVEVNAQEVLRALKYYIAQAC